jgi:hypothetical protein
MSIAAPEIKTRFVGNCQICEADQKLKDGLMVHHGFRRPGDGYIHGDCPGVSEQPYETSCDLLKSFKVATERELAVAEAYVAKLRAGAVTFFTVRKSHYMGFRREENLVTYAVGVTEPWKFSSELQRHVVGEENRIKQLKWAIERYERRIAAWEPKPIRTMEEEASKARADREKREKDAAERRATRQAEEERKRQKREALDRKRQAIKDGFIARLAALIAPGVGVDVEAEKRKIIRELRLKKNEFIWGGLRGLKCEEICIKLGLARRDDKGWVSYVD